MLAIRRCGDGEPATAALLGSPGPLAVAPDGAVVIVDAGEALPLPPNTACVSRRAFPIRRVRLVDRFDADDRSSMRHDNTSAFYCRHVAGTTTWSQHAYGRAIDINPVENPFVDGSHVFPRRGRRFLDRTDVRPGMIVEGGVVVRAFRGIGWGWGGAWSGAKDYQHLSANGR